MKELMMAIPEGYALDREADMDECKYRYQMDLKDWEQEKHNEEKGSFRQRKCLPIVHAYYLMFQKQQLFVETWKNSSSNYLFSQEI